MTIEIDPQLGIHRLVKNLKGVSSHQLRKEFASLVSRLPTLWTNSYFVSTVGGAPLSVIKQYVENQNIGCFLPANRPLRWSRRSTSVAISTTGPSNSVGCTVRISLHRCENLRRCVQNLRSISMPTFTSCKTRSRSCIEPSRDSFAESRLDRKRDSHDSKVATGSTPLHCEP